MKPQTESHKGVSIIGIATLFFALLLTLGGCDSAESREAAREPFVGIWRLTDADLTHSYRSMINLKRDGTGYVRVTVFDQTTETNIEWEVDEYDVTIEYSDGTIETGTLSEDGETLVMLGNLNFTKD
ncbi:MAG: hypothetical protein GX483_03800 [Actinomycetaceae bacterium]|nr:hypothetical protein [Actinomycetaceae bacterium]